MLIRPARSLQGKVRVPGDKSISHRAVILASIADGVTRIESFASGRDCAATVECMRRLGVRIEEDGPALHVHGVGKRGLRPPQMPLDCGNSGTTMRLLAGLLAGQPFESTLIGDDSLQARPMGRVIEPLTRMGASIASTGGRAPLKISGRPLKAISYELPVASAQVKSCVLLAGLYADGKTVVLEPNETRDHTERMLGWLGAGLSTEHRQDGGKAISLDSSSSLTAKDLTVPGDISSAAYFLIAGACLPGSLLSIENVGVNPTRHAIVETLRGLGSKVDLSNERVAAGEPVADIGVRGGLADSGVRTVINGRSVALLIDEIPVLAVLGTQLKGGLEVQDARELRLKESDRIAAIVSNLTRMGASAAERDDGFVVEHSRLHGEMIDPAGDHRIAMAFAVAGLLADTVTDIAEAGCADVSFPGFFDTLAEVVRYE